MLLPDLNIGSLYSWIALWPWTGFLNSVKFFIKKLEVKIVPPSWRYIMYMYMCVCISACSSRFSHVRFFVTPWTVARQTPLSMRFSRQEYWSGLPCPPLGDLPDPGIETAAPAAPALQADSWLLSHQGSQVIFTYYWVEIKFVKYLGKNKTFH